MVTKELYVKYLISTPANYTCTNLADHLEGTSHDAINDYLRNARHSARYLWDLAEPLINQKREDCLIVDDTVLEKPYAKKMELVRRQWSGKRHCVVDGIGIVNLMYSDQQDAYPIDFRVYAPDLDGKTKNDHFQDMVRNAFLEKEVKATTVLFDSWYASVENLKLIHRLGKTFVTTLKENRRVSLSVEQGYISLKEIEWSEEQLRDGISIKLKEVPFQVKLFKIVATDGNIDWMITNNPGSFNSSLIQQENQRRWVIEQLHRELKQLTGIEKCQCRKQRAQRNHFFLCYQAWFSLKVAAKELKTTLYKIKQNLWKNYLKNELQNPHITIWIPT